MSDYEAKGPGVLPCIICGKALGPAAPGRQNQPSDGTSFSSRGQYGSTVFDPMDGSALEVNFCDPCLMTAQSKGHVLHYQHRKVRPWTGK